MIQVFWFGEMPPILDLSVFTAIPLYWSFQPTSQTTVLGSLPGHTDNIGTVSTSKIIVYTRMFMLVVLYL